MNPNSMTQPDRTELERALFWLHNFTKAQELIGELIMINERSFEVTGIHLDCHLTVSIELIDIQTRTCHSINAQTLFEDWIYLGSDSVHQLLRKAIELGITTIDEDNVTHWKGVSYHLVNRENL